MMSKIMFFCIPATGHTNPTLRVVEELTRRGHQVRYYSFNQFREKIEAAGAEFISCDEFLPEVDDHAAARLKRVSTTEMTVQDFAITARLDPMLTRDVQAFRPDCIVSDSVCFWGKLIAAKFNLPLICSTTTFAFNRYSSQYISNSPRELLDVILGMPRINRALKKLRPLGYHVKSALSIVQNDNDTNTIVYTSRNFQPCADTFSDRYAFIGPSVRDVPKAPRGPRPLVYVSLGTVLSNPDFYRNCIAGLKDLNADVILSIGRDTPIAGLGALPDNIRAFPYVDQMDVLSRADVFISHCGMNSVNEALYMGIPLVMFPQTGEQKAVARRAAELSAGLSLTDDSPTGIRAAVETVLQDDSFRRHAEQIGVEFRTCPGAAGAADFIEKIIAE